MYVTTNEYNEECELCRAVSGYLELVTGTMGTKRGELSNYGMSIRYPYSTKGTAALSDSLPPDTIEIHQNMANIIKVKTGDVVLVERFPCLGFMSIRPQYVQVTNDKLCKYVIRASGNSLVSQNLDFDGDTLFIASFHTPAAIKMLQEEMAHPNQICKTITDRMNAHKVPQYKEFSLEDFNIHSFPTLTSKEQAKIVRSVTGVKSHTGPVIALAYNLMRIVEANVPYSDTESHANIEVLLDFLGNTVFKQKHGIKSLQQEATDAICVADVEKMVYLGFDRRSSDLLCSLVQKEAKSIGVANLEEFHAKAVENHTSKIINKIVRSKNKLYFATRAKLSTFVLLDHLTESAVDLPSFMLTKMLNSKRTAVISQLENIELSHMKIKNSLTMDSMKEAYSKITNYIDEIMVSSN